MPQAIHMKRRIRSIRSTKKIMKAMELIAATKWRKALQDLQGIRDYAQAVQEAEMATHASSSKLLPFADERSVAAPTELLVVIASDRGLCGGYHTRLLKHLLKERMEKRVTAEEAIVVGKRAEALARKAGFSIQAAFPGYAPSTKTQGCRDLITYLQRAHATRPLALVFTQYTNGLTQEPTTVRLPHARAYSLDSHDHTARFEPSTSRVADVLAERAFFAEVLTSVYHGSASEQAARVQAMKQASSSATDMLDSLTLALNQTRQAAVTQELAELSASMLAIG